MSFTMASSIQVDSLVEFNSSGSSFGQECALSSFQSNSPVNLSPTTSGSSNNSIGSIRLINRRCGLCNEVFLNLKVLSCLHTFCQLCLESNLEHSDKIMCPQCQEESPLPCKDLSELLPDFSVKFDLDDSSGDPNGFCNSCKNKTSRAVSLCYDCNHYLCSNCVTAHKFMYCFAEHKVVSLSSLNVISEPKTGLPSLAEKAVQCPHHNTNNLKYFCKTCSVFACKTCAFNDHPPSLHVCEQLSDVGPKVAELMNQTIQDCKSKAGDISNMVKTVDHFSGLLQVQYNKAQNDINDTFQFYRSMLEERKGELLKELDSVFSAKQMSLTALSQKASETVDKISNICNFFDEFTKHGSTVECLMFKKIMDSKLKGMTFNVDALQSVLDLEFVSNYQAIQVGVKNTFGYVRSSSENNLEPSKQPPIARPNNGLSLFSSMNSSSSLQSLNSYSMPNGLNTISDRQFNNAVSNPGLLFEPNNTLNKDTAANSLGLFSTSTNNISVNGDKSYQKWPSGSALFQKDVALEQYSLSLSNNNESILDIKSSSFFVPKSHIKRQKMIYHCKFGEFGVLEGQFTEPSGVAVNAQNDIIVADTNNHRIQVFDKEGRFKFQFGECGRRDGQLLYPNRVAVMKASGDIVVTERSPTHQIQIYNHYGQFVRKFGANILQHPRGVTVDNKGRIIVVECKVMRVIIFDQNGNVLHKFGCSKHLEFPNGVVVNENQEIFVSDNRAHSVKVFNYEGDFLRQIGHEGVTNYPIGVGINSAGEILIADNHNNFNVTVFSQNGQLLSAFESKVKHAQCFCIALLDDGSVVLASKDYRIYLYRYVPISPIGA